MIIIGEKINGTRSAVAEAIKERDEGFIRNLAAVQFKAGAKYLDVNAGTGPDREPDDLAWLVGLVREAAPEATIALDSANPAAIEAGLAACGEHIPMINSLSGEKSRIEGILPLAVKHKTELVVLALDDRGIPDSCDKRLEIVAGLVALCRGQGLTDEKLFIDPLVLSIATGTQNGLTVLDTIRALREKYPKAHQTCGHSNISFGMPLRSLVNQAFMALTIQAGLDSAIMDPENRELTGIMMAAETLLGRDKFCMKFNKAYQSGLIGPNKR